MAGEDDDNDDKNFEPSQRKLDQAREKGDVPQSKELHGLGLYIGLLLPSFVLGEWMVDFIGSKLVVFLSDAPSLIIGNNTKGLSYALGELLLYVILGVSPLFIGMMVLPILSMVAQNSITFSWSKLELKFDRLSLLSNFKNKFGRDAMVEFLKGNIKISFIAIGVYMISKPIIEASPAWVGSDGNLLGLIIGNIWMQVIIAVTIVGAAISVADFLWQRYAFHQKMMMSFQELKDEHKDMEGDPHMKHKRKEKGREIAMKQMVAKVPEADVVIVNPTHYAVALKWSGEKGTAPLCIAKGTDEIALAMKAKAAQSSVPVREDAPLARTLFASVDIDEQIRPEHYAAVAAALRFASAMRKKQKQRVYE